MIKMLLPLQGVNNTHHLPRALPWADGCCPFGALLWLNRSRYSKTPGRCPGLLACCPFGAFFFVAKIIIFHKFASKTCRIMIYFVSLQSQTTKTE